MQLYKAEEGRGEFSVYTKEFRVLKRVGMYFGCMRYVLNSKGFIYVNVFLYPACPSAQIPAV